MQCILTDKCALRSVPSAAFTQSPRSNRMDHLNRRRLMQLVGLGALGAAGTTALTACGGGSGGNSICYAWWGDTVRQLQYTAALEAFSPQHPGVAVPPEFADYDAFQERITVQTAGRDVPDVFWIPSPHV